MLINNFEIGSEEVYVIAEVGSNHEGDLSRAKEHIDAAQKCGAHAVKFQSLNAAKLYINPSKAIADLHKLIDFEEDWHYELKSYADKKRIVFCSSPTYLQAVNILMSISVDFFKIASAQVATFPQLVAAVACTRKPALLSTGIASYSDLTKAVELFEQNNNKNYAILHCNSQYPTLPENVFLGRIETYKKMFGCPVGYSDHTIGNCVALAAVAKGADIIEKHFKLDSRCISPDAELSITPDLFTELVKDIKSVKDASADKPRVFIEDSESAFRESIRYKLVLNTSKRPGDNFYHTDFDFMRSSSGIDAAHMPLVISSFCPTSCLEPSTILSWSDVTGK